MPDCSHIDALVTPFVDGVLPAGEQQAIERHLAACSPCRARVAAERAIHTLMRARRTELAPTAAPADLKARCALLCSHRSANVVTFPAASGGDVRVPAKPTSRAWFGRLAMAASLILAVGGALIYQATRSSSTVLAAELAMDHEKCFRLNHVLGTRQSPDSVEASMMSWFDWTVHLPDTSGHEDVSLVGSRPCLYGEGKAAHIMYMHNGQPVSLFMLPRQSRQDQIIEVFGHRCRIWSEGDRTFVLVARDSAPEMEQMAALVRTTIR
jgi:anti-sigma factor RsiW